MTDRYGLIGHPVAHSISPAIHALFAEQTGQDMTYSLLPAPPDGFRAAVADFVGAGGRGVNVTLPFKEEALRLADEAGPHAAAAGAANTLVFRDDRTIYAANTDGVGLARDLAALGLPVAGRELLIVGAGGASRGIVRPLLEAGARLAVANRTRARAEALVRELGASDALRCVPLDALADARFDGVINATSASLADATPALPDALCAHLAWGYDLVHGRGKPTAFVEWLRARGVSAAHDGAGMLLEQAAESFYLWRGARPDVGAARAWLAAQKW